MPVVISLEWDGVTPEQYDDAHEKVNWEGDTPDGALLHVPWFADGAMHVTDVWDSAEQFERFVNERLMPGVQEIGIEGEPRVEINPLHRHVFAPGIDRVTA